jgi:hypothetical protein
MLNSRGLAQNVVLSRGATRHDRFCARKVAPRVIEMLTQHQVALPSIIGDGAQPHFLEQPGQPAAAGSEAPELCCLPSLATLDTTPPECRACAGRNPDSDRSLSQSMEQDYLTKGGCRLIQADRAEG